MDSIYYRLVGKTEDKKDILCVVWMFENSSWPGLLALGNIYPLGFVPEKLTTVVLTTHFEITPLSTQQYYVFKAGHGVEHPVSKWKYLILMIYRFNTIQGFISAINCYTEYLHI